jgi:hypothetical protein
MQLLQDVPWRGAASQRTFLASRLPSSWHRLPCAMRHNIDLDHRSGWEVHLPPCAPRASQAPKLDIFGLIFSGKKKSQVTWGKGSKWVSENWLAHFQFFWIYLYPSKSGLIHKHIVKHIVDIVKHIVVPGTYCTQRRSAPRVCTQQPTTQATTPHTGTDTEYHRTQITSRLRIIQGTHIFINAHQMITM